MKRTRIKVTRQLETNDCGPACLHMIANYYGHECSLEEIKASCEMTRIGLSMRDIKNCARLIGLETFVVKLTMDELKRMPCPGILYFKRGHFVVLEEVEAKDAGAVFHIVDPECGRMEMTEEGMLDSLFSGNLGVAALFAPSDDYNGESGLRKPIEKRGLLRKALIDIFKPFTKKFSLIAMLSIVTMVANWAMPLLLKTTIDDGIMDKNIGIVWLMLAAQLAFFIGFMVANTFSSFISTKTGQMLSVEFITNYFNKVIKLPIAFFDSGLRTDLIRKLGDLSRIQSFVTGSILSTFFALLNIGVFSVILMYYSPVVFVIFLSFSILSFIYNQYFVRKRKFLDYASFSVESERANLLHEMVTGMHEIKLNNAQKARIGKWDKIERKSNRLRIKQLYLDNYISNGSSLFGRLRDITLTGLCAFMVINDTMSMGVMMMVSFLLGQLASPISTIIEFTKSYQDVKLSYNRLEHIYEHPEESSGTEVQKAPKSNSDGIKLEHVSFRYKGTSNPDVLKDVSLDIPKGKITAIVGESGGGKTTILKLLLGFYAPNKGNIYINNQNLNDLNLDSWRECCGVVMQDGRIFSGTVAENIAFSDENPDEPRLRYACEVACIMDKINKLPMGFNTRIGETGIDLSGGEKQRILIARAVYKNPEFIFFDEATSSLDASTERAIMNNLFEFYEGRTVVVIAHRLSTVKNAHNIVFMKDGRIVEQGTHENLLGLKGNYHNLVGNQLEFDNVEIK